MKKWRKVVANHNGALEARDEDRPTNPDGYPIDLTISRFFYERDTQPDLSSWKDEIGSGTRTRAITAPGWSVEYARAQFSTWAALRLFVAVRLARLAAWIAP